MPRKKGEPNQPPVKIDLPFDEAIRAALKVKPPEKPKRKPRRKPKPDADKRDRGPD